MPGEVTGYKYTQHEEAPGLFTSQVVKNAKISFKGSDSKTVEFELRPYDETTPSLFKLVDKYSTKESPMITPEEVVRQLYAAKLMDYYGYSKNRLSCEYVINFGRECKRADIVVKDQDGNKTENKITLKVMPKDVEIVRDKVPEIFSGNYFEAKVSVIPDGTIKEGGVIIETSNGLIDASIETQLAIIEKALKSNKTEDN